jgi:hypothetical protein
MTAKRVIAAGVCGVVSAFLVVALVEGVAHAVYAPAVMPDLSVPGAMEAFIATMPLGAFLFVLAAYLLATIAGGVVASAIARRHAMAFAIVVGVLILAASIANFVALPHPVWFVMATLVGVPLTAWLTGRTARRWAPV